MANSLNEDKCEIQYQRYKGGEDELRLVVQRTEFLGRKVRKDHRETGQRNEDGQSGARALSLESLFAVADAAHQQTCTDDAVAHDHDRREDRVTCQSGFFGRRCDHDRDDEGRLDHRYGQGEDKRTEWLANAVCDHLRMVDCGKNGAEQSCSGCGVDGSTSAENECDQQDCPRERGPNPRPPSRPCHSHADSHQKSLSASCMKRESPGSQFSPKSLGGQAWSAQLTGFRSRNLRSLSRRIPRRPFPSCTWHQPF